MAAQEIKPVWEDKPQSEAEAWLRTLADDVPDSGGLPTSGIAGFAVDEELSVLLDKLAAEGPVRGEPFK